MSSEHTAAIDVSACLQRGAIGAVGAVPGTLAAHPFDVVKMRQQVGGLGLSATLRGIGSAAAVYNGVLAGVAQKITTRGPMFLASEVFTQQAQRMLSLDREKALFVGSLGSGYTTGFVASTFEWQKVQRGAASALSGARGGASASAAAGAAVAASVSPPLSRRLAVMRAAGTRNAVFDSTFFSCEHVAQHRLGLPPALSYAAAAAIAVCLDFPVDVATKRIMAAPPQEPVPAGGGVLRLTLRLLLEKRLLIFAGLGCKCVEFAVSYGVTGWSSAHVKRALS